VITPKEARLLALERKQARIGEILRGLRQDVAGSRQGIWDAWGDLGVAGAAPTTCTATYSGTLLNCAGAGFVGQTITVKDGGGATLGTATSGVGGAFSGSVTITSPSQAVNFITAGIVGYADSSLARTLSCGANAIGNFSPGWTINHAPTLNTIANQTNKCATGASFNVALAGITDGDGGTQTLSIAATSNFTGIVPNPTITYTSPNTTGTLTYTPTTNVGGVVTISVAVTDSGGTSCGGVNKTTRTFTISTLNPTINPTINAIANQTIPHGTSQNVFFSGVGPASGAGVLTVTVVSSAPGTAAVGTITYASPNATGIVQINAIAAGSCTVTVTVTSTCGGTATASFGVTVT
jgi:hypothetical protein